MNQPTVENRIEQAIETFVGGFTFTRSFTYPYLAERINDLWVMRDAPRKRADYRSEEWVAYGRSAEEIDRIARKHARSKFVICAIGEDESAQTRLRADFKALNYRLISSEPLMVHSLTNIPFVETGIPITQVLEAELADRLAKAAGSRQILPSHLTENAPIRQYVAEVEGQLVGWVRSICVKGKAGVTATWHSNMFVEPAFRRRGIARSLLWRMLQEDRAHGAKQAVLLASHAGAKLYPLLGYEQIATLLIFTPKVQQQELKH